MQDIQRGYKFRCYPTEVQQQQLAQTFGCCRVVYNHFLKLRTDAWYERQERVYYNETAKMLTALKKDPEFVWLNAVSNVCLQQSLRHLDRGFANFFQGLAHYPTEKKKHQVQRARYMDNGFSFKDGQLKLAKQETPLAIRWHRALPETAKVTSVTITKDRAERYFVSFQVQENIAPQPVVAKTIGIDLGINAVAVCSDGQTFENKRPYRRSQQRLAKAQRQLSRKVKGSHNRRKARLKVAKLHAKVADQRADFNHKLTAQLIHENQVISAETLAVKNLLQNPKLAQSIADVGWGQIIRQLAYKAAWAGRTFVQIDRWFPSSKRCSTPGCGYTREKLPLHLREWDCPQCGAHHHRDRNAAINIDQEGKAILAGAMQLRIHQ